LFRQSNNAVVKNAGKKEKVETELHSINASEETPPEKPSRELGHVKQPEKGQRKGVWLCEKWGKTVGKASSQYISSKVNCQSSYFLASWLCIDI
jgi:hypothetical protein